MFTCANKNSSSRSNKHFNHGNKKYWKIIGKKMFELMPIIHFMSIVHIPGHYVCFKKFFSLIRGDVNGFFFLSKRGELEMTYFFFTRNRFFVFANN